MRRVALVLAALAVAPLACTPALRREAPPHPFFRGLAPPLVIAHRGGADLWPENTLLAFRRALALGVDVLELDLQVTADGVLVVLHDATVDRTTNGRGAVHDMTLAALQALDAGYRWSADGGRTFPYRGRGIVVPTLARVLDAFPTARLLVEIKPPAAPAARALCRTLVAMGATDRVLIASMAAGAIAVVRSRCATVATGATPREVARFVTARALRLLPLPRLPAVALHVPERWRGIPVLTPGLVAAARARGLQIHAWTINREARMRRVLALGVDGVVTDRPDRLLAILGRRRAAAISSLAE